MRQQGFNNAEAGGIWAAAVSAVSNLGGTAINKAGNNSAKNDVKAICGREPVALINPDGHEEWLKCASVQGKEIVAAKTLHESKLPVYIWIGVGLAVTSGLIILAVKWK